VEDPKSAPQNEDPPLRRATYDEKDHTPADGLWRSKFHESANPAPSIQQPDVQPPTTDKKEEESPDAISKPEAQGPRLDSPPPDNDYYQP